MKIAICAIVVVVACVCSSLPAYPKKYDPLVHGIKKSSYGLYKKKLEYPLKAPIEKNSYNNYAGALTDPLSPPDTPAYVSVGGETHGEMAPPPQEANKEDGSSYLVYDGAKKESMEPPKLSSYLKVSTNGDSSDVKSSLSAMARVLPTGSSYSNYWAESNPQKMLPPKKVESTYTAYESKDKPLNLKAPSANPKKEKTMSSYSSYE